MVDYGPQRRAARLKRPIFQATMQMPLPLQLPMSGPSHKHQIIPKDASEREGHESCHQCDSN
jgi:hypothetical protein